MSKHQTSKIRIRRAGERGHAKHGWLESYHTFSFAGYHDPQHMGFRSLRVINEDRVAAGRGFGAHPHDNMEIITYVVDGALEHQDSTGGRGILSKGEIQKITAGSGITHSEMNASQIEPVHFLQIWILPNEGNLEPSYGQVKLTDIEDRQGLRLIAAPGAKGSSLKIHQDALLYHGELSDGSQANYAPKQGRGVWIQLISGTLEVEGHKLEAGDGLALEAVDVIKMSAVSTATFLLFDLA